MTRLTDIVRCMSCQNRLELVHDSSGGLRCKTCNWMAGADILDFVRNPALTADRAHYDARWVQVDLTAPADPAALHQIWTDDPRAPTHPAIRARIGDVRDKVVVVLGNGVSLKELALLQDRPRLLVISDLSLAALRSVRARVGELERDGNLEFASIDALDMPFEDNSVDVLHGTYFVSQLPDVDRFLREAVRVLAPGGRAVFKDRAYAPLLDRTKQGALRSVRRAAHRSRNLSPGDRRFMLTGGFKPADLERHIRQAGAVPWFERSGFVHYGAVLASRCFTSPSSRWRLSACSWEHENGTWRLRVRHARLLRLLDRIDRALHRLPLLRRNEVRLVWGFDVEDAQPQSVGSDGGARVMVER